MVDDRAEYKTDIAEEDRPPRSDKEKRRSSGVVITVVVIVLVILALLMFRGCSTVQNAVSRRSATNQIVPVEGRPPVDGKISVWVSADTTIDEALAKSGVKATSIVDMGTGKYVLTVKVGAEVDAVRVLRGVKGVYDAGRVYSYENAKQ